MDTQIGAYSGYVSLVLILVGGLIAACQRHRIRSTCCGSEVSVALETTTPERKPSVVVDGQTGEKDERLVGTCEEGKGEESRQDSEGGHGEGKRVL